MVPLATVNTRNILFICGGAFPGLEDIIKERLNKTGIHRISCRFKGQSMTTIRISLEKSDTGRYPQFRHDPEFIGRLPIVSLHLRGLTKEMLVKILKEAEKCHPQTVSETAGT